MKFPLEWLKDHLETEMGVEEIGAKLTSIGLEVERIEDRGAALRDFVVAEVISAEKHPNADRLKLCMVNDGGKELIQVVCGAPNASVGLKAVFARPGTVIPANGEALKIGTIRGERSRGMLCSAAELLISEESDGIIELPSDAKPGEPVARVLGLEGAIIDVAITPNRGDAASVYGLARDLAAAGLGKLKDGTVTKIPGKFPSPKKITLDFPPAAADACPLFAGRLIRGVKNGPSPQWVQDRLKSIGHRSISALVDATNLIAHDRGRPLHVFDADKLTDNLSARLATDGEKLLALDGKTYELNSQICVIADDARALGIAGVMGSEESGCTEATVNVFIESAYFDPARTARTGRKLGIVSDARYRFERGVDPEFVAPGLELATKLIVEWCGGEASEIVVAGAVPPVRPQIPFDPASVEKRAGVAVPKPEVIRILKNLGFAVADGAALSVTPPSWRSDVEGSADLIEEIVRIYGLDKIPSIAMERPSAIAAPVLTPAQRRLRTVRRALAARGFNETVSFSFVGRDEAKLFGGGDDARELANPIAANLDALRPSLLPSLLAAAARNQARGIANLMLFEIGAQFESGMPGAQMTAASGIRVGEPERHWTKSGHAPDAFDAKADMMTTIEAALGVPMGAPIKSVAPGWYHPGRSGTLALGPVASSSEAIGHNKNVLGHFGEMHPKILRQFDLKGPGVAFEIFLEALPEPKPKSGAAFSPSSYQAISRDFAFVIDESVRADDVVRAAKTAERHLIETISVFDVYAGKGVPEGKKSIAISVRLQPADKTLTDPEIEAVAEKIIAAVVKATGGSLRA